MQHVEEVYDELFTLHDDFFLQHYGCKSSFILDFLKKIDRKVFSKLGTVLGGSLAHERWCEWDKKHPDLLVHIRVSFETMLERINKRGREYEQLSFDPTLYDYYQELNLRYDQWYEEYQESPKIQIDGDQFNFVEDPEAAQKVLAMVDEALAKVRK